MYYTYNVENCNVENKEKGMALNKELIEIMVCPDCRGKVTETDDFVKCNSCGKRYPIRDGIPIMLISEAITPEEKQTEADN